VATPTQAETPTPPTPEPTVESDVVAQAKAEAIRAEAWAKSEEQRIAAEADAEERRIKAEADAKATVIKAEEDARKQRIANDRAEARFEEEQAARDARIAKSNKERKETERAEADAAVQDEIDKKAAAESAKVVAKADKKWRGWAIAFYTLCATVALPVQISAFWNPNKPWMAGAPVLLEIAALVVAFGTAAAVANQRPHWHFRLITWVLAFIAASVNFGHGITEFDLATAIGTALASIFGPGVWDLHEHGRIRKRDGILTRRERKAAKKEAERIAKEKAAEEASRKAEKEAANEAAAEAAKQLAETRAKEFPKVWEHALKLAADLGETTITEAIWKRAKLDVDGALPGESAEIFRMRNVAQARVESARTGAPVNTLSKTTNAQRAAQMPPGPNRVLKTRATRRPGDTPKYAGAARKQAAITAKNAAKNDRPSDN
jgi:Skp family chaperone for outer membrane proteins